MICTSRSRSRVLSLNIGLCINTVDCQWSSHVSHMHASNTASGKWINPIEACGITVIFFTCWVTGVRSGTIPWVSTVKIRSFNKIMEDCKLSDPVDPAPYIYIYVRIWRCLYILSACIYIQRERERERERSKHWCYKIDWSET